MKKSRFFMAIAIMALTISGLAAGRTAKKYTFGNLYYYNGFSYFFFSAGCLASLFTTTSFGSVAKIEGFTGNVYSVFYNPVGSVYVHVYNAKF